MHKNGYTSLPGGFDISKAQGDIQKPNKLRINAEIISNNFLIKLSYLSMDNNYWITNPISFEWVETSQDDNPFKNINPVNILSDIFSEIENATIISSQNYDYEISADINSENLKSLVGDIIVTNKNVRLSLNINQDGIVDSIKIYGIVQPNDSIDTQREIKFERWNENLKSLVGDIIVSNKNVRLSLNINQDGIVDSIKIYGIVQPNDTIDTQREIKFERWNENLKWETP